MEQKKKSLMMLMSILIFCIWALPVMAAEQGSITIQAKAGSRFSYAKIGEIEEDRYVLNDAYKKSGVDLNRIAYAKEMERAVKKLDRYMKPEGSILTDEKGNAKIEHLTQGIYLLRSEETPILVTLPSWDEQAKTYVYDVTVVPKTEHAVAPQTNLNSSIRLYLVVITVLLMFAAMLSWKVQKESQPYRVNHTKRMELREAIADSPREQTPFERKIDFESLKSVNDEIYGWLYIPGTQIDDPILIGKTDVEYLHKNFKGEKSALGSIFGFSDTRQDFSDAHICLFGHNMRSGQMFGELKKYREEAFWKQCPDVYLYTKDSVRRYQVFSTYDCEKNDETFAHKMDRESEEFLCLLERISNESPENPVECSQVLTLASCSDYRETSSRFTVNCILKEER